MTDPDILSDERRRYLLSLIQEYDIKAVVARDYYRDLQYSAECWQLASHASITALMVMAVIGLSISLLAEHRAHSSAAGILAAACLALALVWQLSCVPNRMDIHIGEWSSPARLREVQREWHWLHAEYESIAFRLEFKMIMTEGEFHQIWDNAINIRRRLVNDPLPINDREMQLYWKIDREVRVRLVEERMRF